MKNLLMNFPNPLLLLDEMNKEVILANKELFHIFSIEPTDDMN